MNDNKFFCVDRLGRDIHAGDVVVFKRSIGFQGKYQQIGIGTICDDQPKVNTGRILIEDAHSSVKHRKI